MSNIEITFWLDELIFPDCIIDVLLREDSYCIRISNLNDRIFKSKFIKYET